MKRFPLLPSLSLHENPLHEYFERFGFFFFFFCSLFVEEASLFLPRSPGGNSDPSILVSSVPPPRRRQPRPFERLVGGRRLCFQ